MTLLRIEEDGLFKVRSVLRKVTLTCSKRGLSKAKEGEYRTCMS